MFWAKDTSDHASRYRFNTVRVRNAVGDGEADAIGASNAEFNQGFAIRNGLLLENGNHGHFDIIVPLSHIFRFCRDVRRVLYGVKKFLYLQRKSNDAEVIYHAEIIF